MDTINTLSEEFSKDVERLMEDELVVLRGGFMESCGCCCTERNGGASMSSPPIKPTGPIGPTGPK